MAARNILCSDRISLSKLSAVLGDDAQLLANVEQSLGKLVVISGVVAIEQGLVSALDNEAGNIHDGLPPSRHEWTPMLSIPK